MFPKSWIAEAFALLLVMNGAVMDARPINSVGVQKSSSLGQSPQGQPQNLVPSSWQQQYAQKLQMEPQAYSPAPNGLNAMAPEARTGQPGAKVSQLQQQEQAPQKIAQQPSQVVAKGDTSRYGLRYGQIQDPQKLSQQTTQLSNDEKYDGAPTTTTSESSPPPPPPPSPSPEEIAAAEAATKHAALIETIKRDTDKVNTSLTDLMAQLQQDDDILDKTQNTSKSATDLLRDLKAGLSTGADLTASLDTLKILVTTLQKIATNVVEQDDDANVHQLLLNLSSATHALVRDFSSALPPPSDPSAPTPDMPDLTGLDSAVADKEEP
ncbi:hypothetical protein [Absidia glauca]|uniref:Uncharacterized protein n=1 Tax=Absidia glauca TaxID=4829 RepID=A0A168N069_ABSGL|nr:hypothetical protein [Absidia glauca]